MHGDKDGAAAGQQIWAAGKQGALIAEMLEWGLLAS